MLSPLTDAAIFLVATVREGGEAAVRDLLEDLSGLQRSVGFRMPAARLSCVTGIGSALWDRLFTGPRPRELHPFRQWKGARHTAPSTPGDLLFHLRAGQLDGCFEFATKIGQRLAGAVDFVDETHGFKYFDERDVEDRDGNELKILRDNMPFGSVAAGEYGTCYIAYAATPDIPELMLRRMFLGDPYGSHDRILDFSTARTGSLFYAPTGHFLDDLPAAPPGS